MSRLKMAILLVLLLATVVTTATTFYPQNSVSAQSCPGPNESQGTCVTNEHDPNFSECKGEIGGGGGGQNGSLISVCSQDECSYRNPQGNSVYGTCCTGGACYKDNGWD